MNRHIRRLLSATFGEERLDAWLGAVDCILDRQPTKGFGGPLNGSHARLTAFEELKRRCSFDAVVETGTYRGESTLFFQRPAVPSIPAK
jgi:hypothetical protein